MVFAFRPRAVPLQLPPDTSLRQRPAGRHGLTGPDLLYRYESYDLATCIVFKQKIDVTIECLFDVA